MYIYIVYEYDMSGKHVMQCSARIKYSDPTPHWAGMKWALSLCAHQPPRREDAIAFER